MEIGTEVLSSAYRQEGPGKVIERSVYFGEEYYLVFFERTKGLRRLPASDLGQLRGPAERLASGEVSSIEEFLFVFFAQQLQSQLSRDGLVSATNFKLTPLPHQILAVDFMVGQLKPRVLFADEVGLGKTIEAALAYEELSSRGIVKRILVVAPAGLARQWKDELLFKFGEEFMIMNSSTFKSLQSIHGPSSNPWTLYQRVITSIDFVKPRGPLEPSESTDQIASGRHNLGVFHALRNANWDMVIIDEAHKLSKKEHTGETARYKVGKALAESVPILLLLSATPHQGDSERFLNLLSLIDPYTFYDAEQLTPKNVRKVTVRNQKRAVVDFSRRPLFKQRIPSIKEVQRTSAADQIELALYQAVTDYVSQYYKLAEREDNRTFMFLLILFQRMVSSSSKAIYGSLQKRLTELKQSIDRPPKTAETEEVPDADEYDDSESLYETLSERQVNLSQLSNLKAEIAILQRCVSLAYSAWKGRTDEKARQVIEIITEVIKRENDPSIKFLVFTEFIATQEYLGGILQVYGYKVAYLNGKMDEAERISEKRKFASDHQILISTDAGGEGINLQFCHVVVNYDLPWNPMKLEQRIGRVDRIGQENDVFVFNLVLKDTIEEHVRAVLEEKLRLIAKEFGEDKMHDILTALQDDFDFDKVFAEALARGKTGDKELEKIGEEMYLRAREILKKDEILLPFSAMEIREVESRLIGVPSTKVKRLLECFLRTNGLELSEYKDQPGIFHFECPSVFPDFPKEFRGVAFERELAKDSESVNLFSLSNPFVKALLDFSESDFYGTQVTALQVKKGGLSAEGVLSCFEIRFRNGFGYDKKYYRLVFINQQGGYSGEVSRVLENAEQLEISQTNNAPLNLDQISGLVRAAQKEIETMMHGVFQEERLKLGIALDRQETRLGGYYQDKERAVARIAIDNIRESKMHELREQQQKDLEGLRAARNLVPNIKLRQVAWVKLE